MEQFNQDELFKAFIAGDRKAFSQVCRRYYRPLCYKCFLTLKDKTAAHDVAVDSLVAVWEYRENLKDYKHLEALVFLAATRLGMNYARDKKRRREKFYEVVPEEWTSDMVSNPLIYNNVVETMQEVISGLSLEHRLIFNYLLKEGRTPKEVAELLNKNEQTVRNIKADIWKKLMSALKNRDLPLLILLVKIVLESPF